MFQCGLQGIEDYQSSIQVLDQIGRDLRRYAESDDSEETKTLLVEQGSLENRKSMLDTYEDSQFNNDVTVHAYLVNSLISAPKSGASDSGYAASSSGSALKLPDIAFPTVSKSAVPSFTNPMNWPLVMFGVLGVGAMVWYFAKSKKKTIKAKAQPTSGKVVSIKSANSAKAR